MRRLSIDVWAWLGFSLWLVACVAAPARREPGAGGGAGGSLIEPVPGPLKPATGAMLDQRAFDPPVVRLIDAATTAGSAETSGSAAAVASESAAATGGRGANARRPSRSGALVISEVMVDPAVVADTAGEWFEVHNLDTEAVDLQGCSIVDGSAEASVVRDPLHVDAGGFVTFARRATVEFLPDVVTSFSLKNDADELELRCDGVSIDRVAYDRALGFPIVAGAAMSLDPGKFDGAQNDVASAWCASPSLGATDRGSPGVVNPPCLGEDAGI